MMSIVPLSSVAVGPHHGGMDAPTSLRLVRRDATRGQRSERRQRLWAFRSACSPPERRGSDSATVLLLRPDGHGPLRARPSRWGTRLVARLLGSRLDRQLADGRVPEETGLLSARAQQLVSPTMRFTLAEHWRHTLDPARPPRTARDPRVPLDRRSVLACEGQIGQMIDALLVTAPVPVRGCAMAGRLLGDGAGPLYRRGRPAELAAALAEVVDHLDPGSPL
jgi:hypothetical protein